jgi:PAS domain S-box-containing protein
MRFDGPLSHEWLEVTLASIGDAVIATDVQGHVVFLNPVATALAGWSRDEARGRPLADVFPIVNQDTRLAVESPVTKAIREGTVVGLANHTLLIARDGTERPIDDSAAPIRGPQGNVVGVVLVFRDVTERRRAEWELARLAAMVESSEDAIIGKTLDAVITSWNPAAERLYGYTAAEMIGQPIARLVPPDRPNDLPAIMERLRRGERIQHYDTDRVAKDGRRIPISLSISPIKDRSGAIVGAATIARDISERQAAEQQQQEFISMVGHELRHPLTSLKGQAQLMLRRQQFNAHGLEVMLDQTNRLERLVNDLVEVARIQASRLTLAPARMNLVELVQASAAQAQEQSTRHTIRIEAPTAPMIGTWDRDRLGQVLSNLLSNAIKYTPNGGEIHLRVQALRSGVQVSVSDHGVGMMADQLSQVFDRFYRGQEIAPTVQGLGLGLFIARELIAAHGGRIWAESPGPEQGTTFIFTLPYQPPGETPAATR